MNGDHGLLDETSEVGLIKKDYSPRKSVVIDSKNNTFVYYEVS